jgi:hypothetical protein
MSSYELFCRECKNSEGSLQTFQLQRNPILLFPQLSSLLPPPIALVAYNSDSENAINMRTVIIVLYLSILVTITNAFTPPAFGLGALFRPQNIKIIKSNGDADRLEEAGKFFVDAFWTGKVGGGAEKLSPKQAFQLERQQVAEFNKRYRRRVGVPSGRLPGNYAGRSFDSGAELILCVNGSGEIIGCAGVEGERIFLLNRLSHIEIACITHLHF